MKLSKRLKQIEQMVEEGYDHIWDCCCDHGLLGTSLLKVELNRTLHFVEIVPSLITDLENKLDQFYPKLKDNWQTHCIDASKLPLSNYTGKHLIIIAGVGGDLMSRIIEAIHHTHSKKNLEFLLCPVNRQFVLREQLIKLSFSLKDEKLIEDKGRYYEILLLSSNPEQYQKVSAVGKELWKADTNKQLQIGQSYLNKTLVYYKAISNDNAKNVEHIINAYKSVNLNN